MTVDLAGRAKEIVARYPTGRARSALLPLLHLVQERDGYVTEHGMKEVAEILGITAAEVSSVATFYSMYHLRPKGRHVISVCHNLACSLLGAERLIAAFEETVGAPAGGTSPDGEITLERAECLAACDMAPMIQIDYDHMMGPVAVDEVSSIVARLSSGRSDRVEHQESVPEHRELASQRVVESEPGGTSSPENALHPYTAPAPSAFPQNPAGDEPPVTSAPVLEPAEEESPSIITSATDGPPWHAQDEPSEIRIDPVDIDEDFVREEDPVEPTDESSEASSQVPGPAEDAGGEPPPLIDSIALSEEDEDLLRESAQRRGQERRKYAAERLLEEPTYEGGVGPGPADPRELGAPVPPPSEEPEPPMRPRGAE